MIVIRQGGQDAAVGRRAAAAGRDHPRKLGAQGVEPVQLGLHRRKLVARDLVRDFAGRLIGARGEIEQPADGIEWKAELPGVADEIQTLQFRQAVHPMSAGGAHGPGQGGRPLRTGGWSAPCGRCAARGNQWKGGVGAMRLR